jgi:hypothetical protein
MKATHDLCACQLVVSEEIRLCQICHRYWKGTQEFTSVSRVIRTLFPTDYSMVDPEVLEHARIRGARVDAYFSEYLRSGTVTLNSDEWEEVQDYLGRLITWWDKQGFHATAIQEIVYSETEGIAGSLDIRMKGAILDVKCVSKLQPNYGLQLGAYAYYRNSLTDLGIIHVTKKGVRLVNYDARKCVDQWYYAVKWYKTMQELGGK